MVIGVGLLGKGGVALSCFIVFVCYCAALRHTSAMRSIGLGSPECLL
jgi:hypothetical protein